MSAPRFPGVFVEAASFEARRIDGMDFATTAFVGPTLSGPLASVSGPFESFADFEGIHGGLADLAVGLPPLQRRNYVALAAKAFFENGGRRLFVARVGGGDSPPTVAEYAAGLEALRDVQDIAIVAAPGYSARSLDQLDDYLGVQQALLDHVGDAGLRRFAVLDSPPGVDPAAMRDLRGSADAQRAALYYPWVTIPDPLATPGASAPIDVPPSGFVCGLYARMERAHGIWKPSANEPLLGAIDLERGLSEPDVELLSQAGVDVLRALPGRGPVVWGARTLSSDPDWRYVGVRRGADRLQASIEAGIAWAKIETNGEGLWSEIRKIVSGFLNDERRHGAFAGQTEREAFFVRCDASVMTQDDIDSGRLICLVGIAPVRPAEFVILRIGQWVAPPPKRWWLLRWLLRRRPLRIESAATRCGFFAAW